MVEGDPKLGWMRHAVLVAVPVLLAVLGACASDGGGGASLRSAPTETTGGPATTAEPVEDYVIEAAEFSNIQDMTPVRGFFIDNRLGYLDEAIAVAEDPDGGTYPVGTIIQLVPQEAMVKRAPGFDPASNDWEFFSLDVTAEGTEILTRGGSEVVNRFGGSCSGCHGVAEPKFDFVCEDDNGCEPLPIGEDVIVGIQLADPRPRSTA